MQFTSGPTLRNGVNPRTPMTAVVEFETDVPSRAIVSVEHAGKSREIVTGLGCDHRIPVAGLGAGTTATVKVSAEDSSGNRVTGVKGLNLSVPPLPEDFPPFEMLQCDPERREPGAMLFNIRHSPAAKNMSDKGFVVAVDRSGDIVWIYRADEAIGDIRRLRNGNILYMTDGRLTEIDLSGKVIRDWYAAARWADKTPPEGATRVEAEMFHHSVIELPNGNLLVCSMEIRDIEDFPATDSESDAETARVVGDVIVEFASDGTVINSYHLLDLLDCHRVSYDSRSTYWVRRGLS